MLPYYRNIIKIQNALSAHTTQYPKVDFDQFQLFCRKIGIRDKDTLQIFTETNHELPLSRAQFLRAILLIVKKFGTETDFTISLDKWLEQNIEIIAG